MTLTVAFNTVDLGNQKLADGGLAYQDLGYDMDGLCTTSTEHLGCRVPAWATEGDPSDGADGRDNAVAKMLNRGGSSYVTSDSVNQAIASGESPVGLLRLSDYSGEPDDPQVKVEWFVPASSVPGEGGRLDYRVASQWLADSDAGVPDGGTPATSALFVASLPYVVDSTLVAPFPYRVVIIVRDTPVEVLSAVFTGKLVKETSSGQWTLTDGMIAGRSRVATLLSFFPALLKKTAGVVVCTNAPVYPTIKKVICGYADFNAFGAPVPTTDCDGLSIGIGLGSVATAIVGSEPRIVVQNCPEETDPGLDSCVAAPN